MKPRNKNRSGRSKDNSGILSNAAHLSDNLAAYEAFQSEVLPQLRRDMIKGLTAEQLYEKYSALAAARAISIALTETDSSKAIAAVRDVLDRSKGKAKEHKEVEHKLSKLPEKELDAYLLTQLNEMDEIDSNGDE